VAGIPARTRAVAATCGRGAAGPGSAPWTYLPPRSSDATAATRQATIAKSNAMASPLANGAAIRDGKKVCPVNRYVRLGVPGLRGPRALDELARLLVSTGELTAADLRRLPARAVPG
jgi:hypothetical protein